MSGGHLQVWAFQNCLQYKSHHKPPAILNTSGTLQWFRLSLNNSKYISISWFYHKTLMQQNWTQMKFTNGWNLCCKFCCRNLWSFLLRFMSTDYVGLHRPLQSIMLLGLKTGAWQTGINLEVLRHLVVKETLARFTAATFNLKMYSLLLKLLFCSTGFKSTQAKKY